MKYKLINEIGKAKILHFLADNHQPVLDAHALLLEYCNDAEFLAANEFETTILIRGANTFSGKAEILQLDETCFDIRYVEQS